MTLLKMKQWFRILSSIIVILSCFSMYVSAEWENTVLEIEPDNEYLWLSTSGGIIKFDTYMQTWATILPPESDGSVPYSTSSIAIRSDGGLYVAMTNGGLWVYDNNEWNQETIIEEDSFRQVDYDQQDTLWAMGAALLYEYDGTGWIAHDDIRGEPGSSRANYSLDFQSDGTVWISGGWGVTKMVNGQVEYLYADVAIPNRLYVDNDDWTWISRADTLIKTDGDELHIYTPEHTMNPGKHILTFRQDSEGTLWAGGSHWLGSFDGATWALYDSTDCNMLGDIEIYDMFFDTDDVLWMATRSGLLKFDGNTWTLYDLETGQTITAVEQPSDTPSTIDILPAYPNPFNPQTTISCVLPEEADISIIMYDILGREVRTLLDNAALPAGRHSLVWDSRDNTGNQVASGLYVCRIITPDASVTQKLTLIR